MLGIALLVARPEGLAGGGLVGPPGVGRSVPGVGRAVERIELAVSAGAGDALEQVTPIGRVIGEAVADEADVLRFRVDREGVRGGAGADFGDDNSRRRGQPRLGAGKAEQDLGRARCGTEDGELVRRARGEVDVDSKRRAAARRISARQAESVAGDAVAQVDRARILKLLEVQELVRLGRRRGRELHRPAVLEQIGAGAEVAVLVDDERAACC